MLTIQFMPYFELKDLSSEARIQKLLDLTKKEKIVLIEGRLKKEEEAQLIRVTMEQINEKFKGIEIAVIDQHRAETKDFFTRIKDNFMNLLLGDRQGFTIIGPASLVKEIKNDPNKIELLTFNSRKKKK
jgi:hypothetical protein